jgi:hypothetical protein
MAKTIIFQDFDGYTRFRHIKHDRVILGMFYVCMYSDAHRCHLNGLPDFIHFRYVIIYPSYVLAR